MFAIMELIFRDDELNAVEEEGQQYRLCEGRLFEPPKEKRHSMIRLLFEPCQVPPSVWFYGEEWCRLVDRKWRLNYLKA